MKQKENKNKKAMTQLKAYFLIINVVVAIIAFSWMVSGAGLEALALDRDGNMINPKNSATPIKTQTNVIQDISGGGQTIGWTLPKPLPTYTAPTITPTPASSVPSGTYTEITGAGKIGTNYGEITSVRQYGDKFYGRTADGYYYDLNIDKTSIINNEAGWVKTDVPGMTGEAWRKGDVVVDASGQKYNLKTDPKTGQQTLNKEGGAGTPATAGTNAILGNALEIGMLFGFGYLIGGFIGGNADIALGSAFAAAAFVWQASAGKWAGTFMEGPANIVGKIAGKLDILGPGSGGLIIGAAIFIFMYKDTRTEIVDFSCLPYQPPMGGDDCEKCNQFEECSEYVCKSLGQACQLLNVGTEEEKCAWINPHDVVFPKIKMSNVLKGYKWTPDNSVSPPATGVVITRTNATCVKAFTPLEFTITTDEPSQCKIDYNLTRNFDQMSYYIGGTNIYSYNHTEKMSLPSPSAINAVSPQLKNDGTYTLYVRCRDANGNSNEAPYSVRFCVEKGPDTTPPRIDSLSIPSNSPISYNTSSLYLEVYVNEPAQCKWSREDRDYSQMENNMSCATNLREINNNNLYPCRTTLTGIKNMQNNAYYFRCKDQPNAPESERNVNVQSYLYNVIGTQPLNILWIKPSNETIKDATDTVSVNLEVKTDNGYKNGEAICYYTTTQTTANIANKTCIGQEGTYITFANTGNSSQHLQNQRLITGDYTYYIKCVDLGGNAAYACTRFSVEVDRSAPVIVRAYKESEQLKIITNEEADCSYSNKDCNFEIKDGIQMPTFDNLAHTAEWDISKNYYIRCADGYNNNPNPNTCSAVIRPYKFIDKSNVIEL